MTPMEYEKAYATDNIINLDSTVMTENNPYTLQNDGYIMVQNSTADKYQIVYFEVQNIYISCPPYASVVTYLKKGTKIWKGQDAPSRLRFLPII